MDTKQKIEELERRIRELEARPISYPYPVPYPVFPAPTYPTYPHPCWPPLYPSWPTYPTIGPRWISDVGTITGSGAGGGTTC